MENGLYSDIIGYTYNDDAKKTVTQVRLNYSDQGTFQMSGGGLDQMDNTLVGEYGDMDVNTAMMDIMSLSDSRDMGEQQTELPNYMRDIVSNVLTQHQDFPLQLSDSLQTDLDMGAATLWLEEDAMNLDAINPDDLFASTAGDSHQSENLFEPVAYQPLEYAASTQPQSTRASAAKRKAKTKSRAQSTAPEPQTSSYSVCEQPSLEDLGVQAHSPYSDAGSSTDEGSRPRQRRPRVSYDTLTEEQKYQRIRELNNEASRLYRQRHRQSLTKLEKEQQVQEERNHALRTKVELLEKLRDDVQTYVNNVFRQQFNN